MSNADLLQFHAFCLTNTGSRLSQYARAIASVVRPGDTVLDLGTGSGLLALLACRAGARTVYAVESSDAIRLGELLTSANAHAGQIEFIKGLSTELTLPGRVQVIVADIHDTFGLQAGGLQAIVDARDRFLAPGGALIPCATRLLVIPVEAPAVYRQDIDIWAGQVEGVDLRSLRPLAVNQMHAARFERHDLLSTPAHLVDVDLARAVSLRIGGVATAVATRDGTLHGLCGCFVTTLASGLTMTNEPGHSETTNFAQAFLPIETPEPVRAGDHILMSVESRDGHATRWHVEISRPGQGPHAIFDHASFEALPLSKESLRKQADDSRPRLNRAGEVERALLGRFDGGSTTADLARWLTGTFGDRWTSSEDATRFLKSVIERCG